MKRLFAPFILLLGVTSAGFADDLSFTLVNGTKSDVQGIYLSAREDKDWNANLLPEGAVLAADQRVEVRFAKVPEEAVWDVRVIDEEGNATTFDDVDLSQADVLRLVTKDGVTQLTVE